MPSLPPEVDESLLSSASIVRVDVQQVLRFFDEKPPCSRGHATAIVSLLGEDLAAASLRHCLLANGANSVNVRIETVGTGNRSGPRLDRWIEADLKCGRRILFQTEVKSWSAHAIGGKTLAINASAEETRDYRGRLLERTMGLTPPHIQMGHSGQSAGPHEVSVRARRPRNITAGHLLGAGGSQEEQVQEKSVYWRTPI